MHLTDHEQKMLDGELGEPRRFALTQQLAVGRFFDADDFVPVTQAHLMADGEAVGAAGVVLMEGFAAELPEHSRFVIPTVTDPRAVDRRLCSRLKQPAMADPREQRIVAALQTMGCLLTNTCINYQSVVPPVKGEHVAFGDTGSTIYANSVCAARSNFEGGAAALWAALTGRVPRYGYHLDECRLGSKTFHLTVTPQNLTDWGAVGGLIGRQMESYWDVPVITGVEHTPGSDALKHLGAALASYGSTPLFHVLGVTPEAGTETQLFAGQVPQAVTVDHRALTDFYDAFGDDDPSVDVVVFAAPQLSLFELQSLAQLLSGKRIHHNTALLVATSPEIAQAARRMNLTETIENAGGLVLEGVCFYQMYAREMGEANGWRHLLTNSAKLANIIGGYGYTPRLASMARCVEAAILGRLP